MHPCFPHTKTQTDAGSSVDSARLPGTGSAYPLINPIRTPQTSLSVLRRLYESLGEIHEEIIWLRPTCFCKQWSLIQYPVRYFYNSPHSSFGRFFAYVQNGNVAPQSWLRTTRDSNCFLFNNTRQLRGPNISYWPHPGSRSKAKCGTVIWEYYNLMTKLMILTSEVLKYRGTFF